MLSSRGAFGQWAPRLGSDHIDRNDDQNTHASDGTPITYHLELHNPFGWRAKTYMVGTIGKRPFKVNLPIGEITAYGEAIMPSDWVTLSPTSRPDTFVATVGVVPSTTYIFTVDLERETAVKQEQRR
jgi:hypothetical protein